MEEAFVKELYDNVFDLINNKLPYVKKNDLEKEVDNAKKLLDLANNTFEKYRSVFDEDGIKHFEYYASLASGCLAFFPLIESIDQLINSEDNKEYLPMINEGIDAIYVFVKHFEEEKIVTDIVEKFLVHLSSISEYYKAIVASKASDK